MYCTLLLLIFIISVKSDTQSAIKEVNFKNPVNSYNARQISHGGETLYIGSWGQKMDNVNEDTVVRCTLGTNAEDYSHTSYETEVSVLTNPDERTPDKTILHSYFFFTRKEVWKCSDDTANPVVTFDRIVNELVGRKEIFELKYVDGITVTTKTLLDNARTVRIKEIKYFDQTNSRVLAYVGKVILIEPSSVAPSYNWHSNIIKKEKTDKENGYFKEIKFENEQHSAEISSNGLSLTLGSFPLTADTIGNEATTAICEMLQGSNPFPTEFRPKCAQNITKWETELMVPLTAEQVLDKFIIINEEVWLCVTDKNEKFYRVRSEAISAIAISQFAYSDGIIELQAIKVDSKNEGIKFTEVKYKSFEAKAAIIYEGSLLLKEPEIRLPKFSNDAPHDRIRDIQYVLKENRIYKSFISGRGINIKIGTHWESIVGKPDDNAVCVTETNDELIKFTDNYLTKFSVLIAENGTYYAEHIKRDEMEIYFDHDHKEVWHCTNSADSDGNKYSFLRVVNEFTGLGEFFEIEYYDGVELFEHLLSDGRKSVRIFEIKYLHPSTLKVLKYEGNIKLNPGDKFTKEQGSPKFGSSGNAIIRSDEDIYWIISSLKESLKDIEYTQNDYLSGKLMTKQIKSEGKTLDVSYPDNNDNIEKTNKAIECRDSKEKMDDLTKESELVSEEKAGDYMSLISREAWKCSDYEGNEFVRIVSDWRVLLDKISEITYSDGIKVWYELESDGTVIIHLREIFYKNAITNKRVNYGGRVILVKPQSERTSGTVFMSTQTKFDYKNPTPIKWTSSFHLDRKRLYQFFGNDEKAARVVIFGEKWDHVRGDSKMNVLCKKIEDETKLEQAKFNVEPQLWSKERGTVPLTEYFVREDNFAWTCNKKEKDALVFVFHRIVVQFSEKLEDDERSPRITDGPIIQYYDGIRIIDGSYSSVKRAFAFQEIMYRDEQGKRIKYDGTLESEPGIHFEGDYRQNLFDASKKEVQYVLSDNELNYLDLGVDGAVIEFGKRYQEPVNRDVINVECTIYTEGNKDSKYRPRAAVHNVAKQKMYFTDMDDEMFSKFFDISLTKTWTCSKKNVDGTSEHVFFKEENTMISKQTISRIIFHDGVKVELAENDRLRIREIIFRRLDGTVLKYAGTVVVPDAEVVPEDEVTYSNKIRELDYLLDWPKLYIKTLKGGPGVALQIGSRWEKDDYFDQNNDKLVAICELEPAKEYTDSYRIRVVINMINEADSTYKSQEMSKEMLSQYFKIWTQEVWNCKRGEKNFVMIVNVLEGRQDISRIFYYDGVTVKSTLIPFSGEELVQVTEVKFIDPSTSHILKYDGEIELKSERDKKAGRQGTSEQTTQTTTEAASSPANIDWTKVLALTTGDEPIRGVDYSASGKRIQEIHGRSGETIEVGAESTEEFDSGGRTMLCMIDKQIPTDSEPFITKVVVKHTSFDYSLDKDTMKTFFDIQVKCWVCVSPKAMFLRVETKLVGKKSINRVTYHHGITVTKNDPSGEVITIEEIKYLDRKTFKQLKYVGNLESRDITELLKKPEYQDTAVDILALPNNLLLLK